MDEYQKQAQLDFIDHETSTKIRDLLSVATRYGFEVRLIAEAPPVRTWVVEGAGVTVCRTASAVKSWHLGQRVSLSKAAEVLRRLGR